IRPIENWVTSPPTGIRPPSPIGQSQPTSPTSRASVGTPRPTAPRSAPMAPHRLEDRVDFTHRRQEKVTIGPRRSPEPRRASENRARPSSPYPDGTNNLTRPTPRRIRPIGGDGTADAWGILSSRQEE